MASAACICGEDLNASGECWQGMITGGHQGNCVNCGTNALLDGERCCSAECDRAQDELLLEEFEKCQSRRPESGCPLRGTPECGDNCWAWWDIQ